MKKASPIFAGRLETVLWIRPEGRGTFLESPIIKEFAEMQDEYATAEFVIDLSRCPGMDSTFMGMLAGLGITFRRRGKGALKILGTTEKTRASLVELGLHHLSEIEPDGGPWVGREGEIENRLHQLESGQKNDQTTHVRECHENLCEADDKNQDRFQTVLEMMGSKRVDPDRE